VEDLLDFSRVQSGRMELEREPTRLDGLVGEAVRVVAMLAQEKEITLSTELAPDLPEVRVDRHKMRQVVDNLLTNAVKFSHPKSNVHIGLEQVGEQLHLTVQDHGVGIPAEDLPKVFEAFQKTGARPTAGERSTGLGLAIVRNIVQAHGGEIWVESTVGEGSTFHVSVPITEG
jgi:signal transduction histidine kinase